MGGESDYSNKHALCYSLLYCYTAIYYMQTSYQRTKANRNVIVNSDDVTARLYARANQMKSEKEHLIAGHTAVAQSTNTFQV